MGMSASQARLIALTARMNDIEYQGQQINQQRTTLSNQVNALYNSLLNMNVPTPPSTKDFTKVVYSGMKGAAKFKLGSITPGEEKDTYNVDFQYTRTGHCWDSDSDANITQGKQYYKKYSNIGELKTKLVKLNSQTTYEIGNKENFDINYQQDPEHDNDDVYLKIKASDLANYGGVASILSRNVSMYVYGENNKLTEFSDKDNVEDEKKALQNLGDTYVLVQLNKSDFINSTNDNDLVDYLKSDALKNDIEAYQNLELNTFKYSLDESQFSGIFVWDGNGAHELSIDDIENFNPANGTFNFVAGDDRICTSLGSSNAEEANYTTGSDKDTIKVRGADVTLEDLNSLFGSVSDTQRKAYIEGLKNRFPEEWKQYSNAADGEAQFLALFKGYVYKSDSGTNVYKIMLTSDIRNNDGKSVPVYDYIANGTYEATESETGCKLEFDTSGRIIKVGIPNDHGSWDYISLEATEVTDDKAYQDAFNQYEYKKYLYDQEQKEINAKTSIIQAEDRSLELKLTRLDNERNAVKTEIDAVKKVVDDNIEKSFKTFSG